MWPFTKKKKAKFSPDQLTAGFLRSSRPSTRAREHFQGRLDISNNELVSESERSRLRSWCKEEYLDNPAARSLARNFASNMYGAGPQFQAVTLDEELNSRIESAFKKWRKETELDWKFLTAIQALFYDGEAFFHFHTNPEIPGGWDIELLEARRIQEPLTGGMEPDRLEGITYNAFGKPICYDVLAENLNPLVYETPQTIQVAADRIMHFFLEDVIGQKRGLPQLQTALEMLASMQRISAASLGAWELASKMNLVIQTGMDAYDFLQCVPKNYEPEQTNVMEAFQTVSVPEDGGMTFLANGMSMNQVRNEHPNSQFGDHYQYFQRLAGAGTGLPENLSTGSSANYNFSSAQLDYLIFSRYAAAVQKKITRILEKCVQTAAVSLLSAADLSKLEELHQDLKIPCEWYFSNVFTQYDRTANAAADVQLKQAGLLTVKEYCKRYGLDYQKHVAESLKDASQKASQEAVKAQTDIQPDLSLRSKIDDELYPESKPTPGTNPVYS